MNFYRPLTIVHPTRADESRRTPTAALYPLHRPHLTAMGQGRREEGLPPAGASHVVMRCSHGAPFLVPAPVPDLGRPRLGYRMATWFLASWPWLVAMGIGLAILGFTLGGWVWVRP